ncbi:glycosyltransferase family 4 protein [Aestuariibacter salexigens]|uniref:glycosyltransferase family 4 protein n=1 Tax=Aestuariibacter salexigens TaxID=226010 RepID=UPI00047B5611|nr:glycosyltransferase family 4 protein [Aestuariibacter salexigens]
MFNSEYYSKQAVDIGIQHQFSSENAYEHYKIFGIELGLRPFKLFDGKFYLSNNPDVAEENIDGLEHFANHGLNEGRYPSAEFEKAFNQVAKKLSGHKTLSVKDIFKCNTFLESLDKSELNTLLEAKLSKLTYEPYVESLLAGNQCVGEPVGNITERILWHGVCPSPLFDYRYYKNQIKQNFGSLELPDDLLVVHWLLIGSSFGISFTPIFCERTYRELNRDLANAKNINLLEHFMFHGIYENRPFSNKFDNQYYLRENNLTRKTPALLHYLCEGNHLTQFSPNVVSCNVPITNSEISTLENLISLCDEEENTLNSTIFREIFKRVETVEPTVSYSETVRHVAIPGVFHGANLFYQRIRDVQRELSSCSFKIIVTIPHCRMSGAAKVAGQLCKALVQKVHCGEILLIRTDQSDMSKPEWFPQNIKSLDLSPFILGLTDLDRQKLLVDVIRGVECEILINVNSGLAWSTISKFGSQLSEYLKIFGYYFCWDRNMRGQRVGYPSMYFDNTFPFLTKIFTDSHFLRDQLVSANGLTGSLSEKLITLHSPADNVYLPFNIAEQNITINNARSKKVIFWAGRLDRQKRFDLVLDVARKCPDIDFWVWGKPVLDSNSYLSVLPANVHYKGEYSSFNELPLFNCDCWLYTSEWDGIPTILLDVAAFGVPLICARVEGISDLVNQNNSWIIESNLCVDSILDAIERYFSASESEIIEKSRLLQEYVNSEHSMESYTKKLWDNL